jgi:SAM-dependent methyltransferase
MAKNNINLQPNYWNKIWDRESCAPWRRNPRCFGRICWAVGHFNEVLDLGCGAGILPRQLLEFGNSITGIDISEVAIAQLPETAKGIVATLPNIPLSDDSFDVVVATEVLEHIDGDQACVKEAVRVLRPNGRAYFAVPNDCLGPDEEPEHVRKYTPDTLEALLSPYGYVFVEAFVDEFVISPGRIIAIPTILAALYTPT